MVKTDALVGRAKKIMMGLLLATSVHALAYQNPDLSASVS
jgi:hypothetical protein